MGEVGDDHVEAEHARRIGLISAAAVPAVVVEVRLDEQRLDTGEQAIKDTADSLLPGGNPDSNFV